MSEEKKMDEEVVIAADAELSPDAKVQVSPEFFDTIQTIIDDPDAADVVKFSAKLSAEAAHLAEQYGAYTFVGNIGRIIDINEQEYEIEAFPALIGSTYEAPFLIGHLLGQEMLEEIASARQQAAETDDADPNEAAQAAALLLAQRFTSMFCTACADDPMILNAFQAGVDTIIAAVEANQGGSLPQ